MADYSGKKHMVYGRQFMSALKERRSELSQE
jgi:hypothetical protein